MTIRARRGAAASVVATVLAATAFAVAARDSPTLPSPPAPGVAYRGEPVLSPGLEDAVARGNVVILHRDERVPAGVEALRAGAPRTVSRRGLAVLLEREPTLQEPLAAVSARRIQHARTAAGLRPFVDAEIGRPAP